MIDCHLAIGSNILKVDGSLPIHIDVGISVVSSVHPICAVHINAYCIVIEVVGIGGDGDDGQIVVVVAIDITAGNDRTGEHSFLEETKAIDFCFADVEDAVLACHPVCERRRSTIDGVTKGGSFRNVDLNGEGVCKETGIGVYFRSIESEVCKVASVVGRGKCGFSCPTPFFTSVLCASP